MNDAISGEKKRPKSEWEDRRKKCYKRAGTSLTEVERRKREGERL